MAVNYYLLNGKNGKGQALDVLVDGKKYRNFPDISTLDLQTMKIKKEDASYHFEELNPGVKIDGMFYDASFPHKKSETKTYAPIFDIGSDKTKKYLNKLREFAEQRNYKIKKGEKVVLDLDSNLDNFIREISFDIMKKYDAKILDYESLIASNLKDIYRERFTKASNKGTEQYMLSKLQLLRRYLSNYTQLRYLVLEYVSIIEENRIVKRSNINRLRHWDNEGMEVRQPINYINGMDEGKQLSLDYFIDLKTGNLKK